MDLLVSSTVKIAVNISKFNKYLKKVTATAAAFHLEIYVRHLP